MATYTRRTWSRLTMGVPRCVHGGVLQKSRATLACEGRASRHETKRAEDLRAVCKDLKRYMYAAESQVSEFGRTSDGCGLEYGWRRLRCGSADRWR